MDSLTTFSRILKFEDDAEILRFRFEFDRYLMWPFIRSFVILEAYKKVFKTENAHFLPRKFSITRILKYIVLTLRYNPYLNKHKDIVFFSSGVVNSFKKHDRYFNRLYDNLALLFNNTSLIIEDSYQGHYRRPRYFNSVSYHDYIHIKAALSAKVKRTKPGDAAVISDFIEYLKEAFPIPLDVESYRAVETILRNISKKLPIYAHSYKRLFAILRPRIIFVEDASYGYRSYIIKMAGSMNIVTAELQHGLASLHHPAYNYSAYLGTNREFKKYVPDYLLTYGDYWNKYLRTPSTVVTIGTDHPYRRAEKFDKAGHEQPKKNKVVLFVSDAVLPNLYNEFIADYLRIIEGQNIEIIFRPHPGEVPVIGERYKDFINHEKVNIDLSTDIYEGIQRADYVVGVFSTCLFESIAMKKKIFIIRHPLSELNIHENIGTQVTDAKDLSKKMNAEDCISKIDPNYFWDKNWEYNFRSFIENVL